MGFPMVDATYMYKYMLQVPIGSFHCFVLFCEWQEQYHYFGFGFMTLN